MQTISVGAENLTLKCFERGEERGGTREIDAQGGDFFFFFFNGRGSPLLDLQESNTTLCRTSTTGKPVTITDIRSLAASNVGGFKYQDCSQNDC